MKQSDKQRNKLAILSLWSSESRQKNRSCSYQRLQCQWELPRIFELEGALLLLAYEKESACKSGLPLKIR